MSSDRGSKKYNKPKMKKESRHVGMGGFIVNIPLYQNHEFISLYPNIRIGNIPNVIYRGTPIMGNFRGKAQTDKENPKLIIHNSEDTMKALKILPEAKLPKPKMPRKRLQKNMKRKQDVRKRF
jgi:hypothetical protein